MGVSSSESLTQLLRRCQQGLAGALSFALRGLRCRPPGAQQGSGLPPAAMMQEKAREVTTDPLPHSRQLLFSSRVTKSIPYLRGGHLNSTSWGQEYQRIRDMFQNNHAPHDSLSLLAFYLLFRFFKIKNYFLFFSSVHFP